MSSSSYPDSLGSNATRVLLIGGLGRSGTTLLEQILATAADVTAVGEVRYLWDQGLRDNLSCACGRRFAECPFWTRVGQVAFGGWSHLDPTDTSALWRSVDRHRYIPYMLLGKRSPEGYRRALSRYSDLLARVYTAIDEVSGGGTTILDSSKDPPHIYLVLSALADAQVKTVHMVRDPRGVAFSWARYKRRPEVIDHQEFMDRFSGASVAARWMDYNALYELARITFRQQFVTVRYEDLTSIPEAEINRILKSAGLVMSPTRLAELGSRRLLSTPVTHSIAGNPVRFHRGDTVIRSDDEWRREMRWSSRFVVGAICAPMLGHYGYSLRTARGVSHGDLSIADDAK